MILNFNGISGKEQSCEALMRYTFPEVQKNYNSYRVSVPDDYFKNLIQYTLERAYLKDLCDVKNLQECDFDDKPIEWVRIDRLPIHPSKVEEYSLLPKWQSALSTLHALNHKFIFLMERNKGRTHLYLGVCPQGEVLDLRSAGSQLCQVIKSQMPGIELNAMDKDEEVMAEITYPLGHLKASGAVTGIPSPRKVENYGLLQNLDQVAFGIRDYMGREQNYAVVVVASPIKDEEIFKLITRLQNMGSEIHSYVNQSVQETEGENHGTQSGLGIGMILGLLASMVGGPELSSLFIYNGLNVGRNDGTSTSTSISKQYLNKLAEYCEQLLDKNIERYRKGRNLGLWNTGVYVLAEDETTVDTVAGMLRSVYSGEESYIEPIRVHTFARKSGADSVIKMFQHIPYPYDKKRAKEYREITGSEGWHPLGPLFEYISTPINTEELSIATSPPRRDVPGLRFVRNAVRFATNPPKMQNSKDEVTIGTVMDTGIALPIKYSMDIKSLSKHGLVTGITGSGKSTTCRSLIGAVMEKEIPVFVVEPAKDEYVSWAIEYNKHVSKEKRIQIFMPGAEEFQNTKLNLLHLNPFEPASVGKLDAVSRLERFQVALMASLPVADVLPMLIEEAIYEHVFITMGEEFMNGEMKRSEIGEFPLIKELPKTAERIISARGYEERVRDNLSAAINTRIKSLTRGKRGEVLNCKKSTPYEDLFGESTVINLSRLADDRDKSLIMSLILISLYEYRQTKYNEDSSYRESVGTDKLKHLTIIEEAHRLLKNPGSDISGIGDPQAVVANMFCELLSEIRAYGEGLLIVDQVPSRLIPDAIKNTNLKIVHRLVAKDDRAAVSSCMALRQEQEDIIAILKPGETIVCSDDDDAASWVKIDPFHGL